jgi:hypothetical protein
MAALYVLKGTDKNTLKQGTKSTKDVLIHNFLRVFVVGCYSKPFASRFDNDFAREGAAFAYCAFFL